MNNKQHYINFCQKEEIPIFSQPYWLDATCGESNWNVVLVKNGNEILASLPYFIESKKGFKMCWMPPLTQKLGPYIKYPENQKLDSRLSFEKKILRELFSELPKHDLFDQNFGENFTYWSPLKWLGYQQTTRYTFQINNIKNTSKTEENYSSSLRRAIRKAEKHLNIVEENNIDKLYELIALTFNKKGGKPKFTLHTLKQIYQSLHANNQCSCLFATLESGEKIAAAFLIWDKTTAYYLAGGANPKYMHLQPQSLLLDKAIKYVSKHVNIFDFEGSMIEDIEKFFRSFGSTPIPYYNISKINNPWLKWILKLKS